MAELDEVFIEMGPQISWNQQIYTTINQEQTDPPDFNEKLNHMNGTRNPYKTKVEQKANKPVSGYGYVYGTPNRTDFERSRMIPSRYNKESVNGELVGPGCCDGYTSKPSGGFNNGLYCRPKYKVDIHRTKNNPQISYTHNTGPVKGNNRRGIIGTVSKNRPDTDYKGRILGAKGCNQHMLRKKIRAARERVLAQNYMGQVSGQSRHNKHASK